jgi:hypothetical protein
MLQAQVIRELDVMMLRLERTASRLQLQYMYSPSPRERRFLAEQMRYIGYLLQRIERELQYTVDRRMSMLNHEMRGFGLGHARGRVGESFHVLLLAWLCAFSDECLFLCVAGDVTDATDVTVRRLWPVHADDVPAAAPDLPRASYASSSSSTGICARLFPCRPSLRSSICSSTATIGILRPPSCPVLKETRKTNGLYIDVRLRPSLIYGTRCSLIIVRRSGETRARPELRQVDRPSVFIKDICVERNVLLCIYKMIYI